LGGQTGGGNETRREQDWAPQVATELVNPRREIDRRADDSKVEPVFPADIAVHHIADM
jgi:hypothetical protein